MEVELNGRKIDLSKTVPLKLRDWKVLEKKGVTAKSLQEARLTDISTVVHYILAKADPSVTMDEVDDLDLGHPVLRAVLKSMNEDVLDRPI